LPFDHQDIRVYVDNLFAEGLLKPVPFEEDLKAAEKWFSCGIGFSPEENNCRRMERLLNSLEDALPAVDARHDEWAQFAFMWAELNVLELTQPLEEQKERLARLRKTVDSVFTEWVLKHYANLLSLPPDPPVVLHHAPRYLARKLAYDKQAKLAFIVVDGLALDQWIVLKEELKKREPGLVCREGAVFAWIPTVTSVSRQAAFSGMLPMYFPDSINTTNKEEELWVKFWDDEGLKPNTVAYMKSVDDNSLDKVSELLDNSKLRVVGLVVDKVDKIIHGMQLGAAGMLNQVRQWGSQGFMRDLIRLLQGKGFQVYLTSDHGNVEAKGIGSPREGVIADLRGERVRVYPDSMFRRRIKEQFPESLEWHPIGLPEDYLPLIAPPREAFVKTGSMLVSHGGISVEELIVPFVQLDRKGG